MEVFSSLPDNRMDRHLQCEIADQLAGDKESLDLSELHLAALLGKTLLGKNEELELKLRKLQDFTEETLAANQTLMRQFTETKDSLHFSNHLCEQQELRVEELEKSNNKLTRLSEERQSLVEQKNSDLAEMEEELTSVRDEKDRMKIELYKMKIELDKTRRNANKAVAMDEVNSPKNERSHSLTNILTSHSNKHSLTNTLTSHSNKAESKELAQLREAYGELTLKLQNSAFQKKRLERELEEVLAENLSLSKNVEKAEADNTELQLKVEELSEYLLVASPNILASPPHASTITVNSRLPSATESSGVPLENTNRDSLFSELDTQYSTLQQDYGELLHKCTCSASLFHKVRGSNKKGESGSVVECTPREEGGGTFKELFDEMFATLRQSAEVADRLIEGKEINGSF